MAVPENVDLGSRLLTEESALEKRLHVASFISDDHHEDFGARNAINHAKVTQQNLPKLSDTQRIEFLRNRTALWEALQRFYGAYELIEELISIINRPIAGHVAVYGFQIVLSAPG